MKVVQAVADTIEIGTHTSGYPWQDTLLMVTFAALLAVVGVFLAVLAVKIWRGNV